MYKKIGIISILLLFALMITSVALDKNVPLNPSRSEASPIVNAVPDGNYNISIQNNVATKILYRPLPTSHLVPSQNELKSTGGIQPTVLYDSQSLGNNANVEKINWKKIIEGVILILQGLTS